MSLVDALLLDPYRDPRDLWLAVRSDAKGSGTIDDPMDAGTRREAPVAATQVDFDLRDIVIISHVPHHYSSGDTLTIQGVTTDPSYNVTGVPLNTFSVGTGDGNGILSDRAIKIRLSTAPTVQHGILDTLIQVSNNATTPAFIGSPQIIWPVARVTLPGAASSYSDLDAVTLAGVGNTWFNGDFLLFGLNTAKTSFYCRLRNDTGSPPSTYSQSGSFTSTRWIYRFDEIMRVLPANSIVRLGPGTFETRGLSAFQQPDSGIAVGFALKDGTKLEGSGIGATTLKLVNAVDFFNASAALATAGQIDGCEICDMTVDSAMPEQPVPYGTAFAMVTCGALLIYVKNSHGARIRRVRAIRFGVQAPPECFVILVGAGGDGFTDNVPPPGRTPFYATPSRYSVIEDCIIEQPSENNAHETTLITNVGDHVLANNYGGAVRHCFTNCAYQNAGHTGGISNEAIAIVDDPVHAMTQPDPTTHLFTVITMRKVNRVAGQNNMVVSGVTAVDPANPSKHISHPYFNGSFEITAVDSTGTVLTCKMVPATTNLPNYPLAPILSDGGYLALVGVDFHAPTSVGVGAVSEGNSVYECRNGFYMDTGMGWSLIQRDNYYSGVSEGAFMNLASGTKLAGEALRDENNTLITDTSDPTHTLAKFTAEKRHNLKVEMGFEIQEAKVGGVLVPEYNGTFTVLAVGSPGDPNDTVFFYRMNGPRVGSADANTAKFRAFWQIGVYAMEGNLFDLYVTDGASAIPPRAGVTLGGQDPPLPPYTFSQWVVRENIVRHVDGAPGLANALNQAARGFLAVSVVNGMIEQNIIDVEDPYPIGRYVNQTVKCFNNLNGTGALLQCVSLLDPALHHDSELAALLDDVLVAAL